MGGIDPKQALRKQLLINRSLLSEETILRLSELVAFQVQSFVSIKKNFDAFHIFLPIKDKKEVDTWPILHWLVSEGKRVYISKSNFADSSMSHILYQKDLHFENDKLGIPTPTNGAYTEMNDLDVVFVPLLGVDQRGSRIGYGMGFYDRFIASMKQPVTTVGLSMAPCFDFFPFMETYDRPLDYCITPFEVIDCAYVRSH